MPVVQPKKKPSQPEEVRVDEALMSPGKYEVTEENTFTVDVYLMLKKKVWTLVSGSGDGVHHEQVVFRLWNYDEMVGLRKKATTYDSVRRMHVVDNDALNRLKIQKFLMSWTFDKDNPRLKLHHVGGVLTDESWTHVKLLQPSILRHIIDKMNEVYERS